MVIHLLQYNIVFDCARDIRRDSGRGHQFAFKRNNLIAACAVAFAAAVVSLTYECSMLLMLSCLLFLSLFS